MKITNNFIKTMLLSTSMLLGQQSMAAPINPEKQPLGYIGPMELSTTDLTNGAKAYRGWFENGSWQGDLIEYNVSTAGVLTTSIDLTTISPAQTTGGTNWSAYVQFAANAGGVSHWDTGRKIITSKNGSQIPFRWSQLNTTQKVAIDSVAESRNAASSDILNFLRGDRSQEKPSGTLRGRYSVLGDIIHANPEYVGAPEGDFAETSYVNFKNANLSRAPRVYVGANDGMLHAFNASNGNEVWAYVPSMVIPKLSRLAGVPYAHRYFVDGGITVQDAYLAGDAAWKTILVGSLGAGGKGLYALDVTDPTMTSELTGGTKLMGELTDSNDDVGYIFDATTITKLNDGKWYAIAGNGIASANGTAKLLLINLDSGALTTISTGSGGDNGLAAPALVDTDGDGMSDIAFAGDINGDMWKFDLKGSTPGSWKLDYRLYGGAATQPITMSPDITNHPQFGFLVMFGTGKLYETADIADKSVQSLYGIWDTGTSPAGSEIRLSQLLSLNADYSGGGFSETVRTFTTVAALDYSVHKGWKVDLPAGERMLTPPQLRTGRLKTTITNPDGYDNWFLEVTFDEGGVEGESIFDLNRDGVLNSADRVDANIDTDLDDPEDIPMAWQRPTGSMSQVTIASLEAGVDTLILNFLNPPIVPATCTGICDGGLSAGHIDVDTDGDPLGGGYGGGTDGHVHEYDDKTNRTYIDYFDIFPDPGTKLRNVTEVGIPTNEDFILLIANADWSPGGELTVNTKNYNVVAYQRMIHKALANWDGVGPLTDPDGYSLIHSIDSITAPPEGTPGGTLRTTFSSTALIYGGLLPTNTGCVNMSNSITKGRWRNGALIMQLVKASHFNGLADGESALDRLIVQAPLDLKSLVVLPDGTQIELMEDLNADTDIDGTPSAYEMYGGLIVKAAPEFLYESSVFWHWDALECYGDPEWEDLFKLTTQGVPAAIYEEMLADAGFADFAELVAYVESLEICKKIRRKNGGCKEDYEAVEALYNMGLLVEKAKNPDSDPSGGGTGGGLSGDPVIIEGGVAEGGITSGPNFESGRRTWIDVLPK